MNVELLKAKILDLAIHGKLVPQLVSEPAVDQIGEVPDEIPFAIPTKWKWVKLDKIGFWKSGLTPLKNRKEFYENGVIPWLKTGDLNDGVIKQIPTKISELALKATKIHINPKGSVLIAMYGATIGKIGILDIPSTTNQACCACTVNNEKIYNYYLFFYLLSQKNNFISLGSGGAQPNISKEKIINYKIPLPPLEEQHRIVAKINELFSILDVIDAKQKSLEEKLKLIKAKALDLAIHGKLVPQLDREPAVKQIGEVPDEIPFEIPEKWKWVHLGSIINIVSSRRILKTDWTNEGIPFFRSREIAALNDTGSTKVELFISKDKYNQLIDDNLPKEGDLMVSAIGTLGKCYLVKKNDLFYYKDASVLCFKKSIYLLPQYIQLLMRSKFMYEQIYNFSSGTTVGSITIKNANIFLIPLPPLEEQQRIVAKINEIFSFCNRAMELLHK